MISVGDISSSTFSGWPAVFSSFNAFQTHVLSNKYLTTTEHAFFAICVIIVIIIIFVFSLRRLKPHEVKAIFSSIGHFVAQKLLNHLTPFDPKPPNNGCTFIQPPAPIAPTAPCSIVSEIAVPAHMNQQRLPQSQSLHAIYPGFPDYATSNQRPMYRSQMHIPLLTDPDVISLALCVSISSENLKEKKQNFKKVHQFKKNAIKDLKVNMWTSSRRL